VLRGPQISVKPSLKKCGYGPILQYCCSVAALHGRWNRGSRGSSCSPNFWHGRAGHSSCSPKSLSLLHCDVRLSRIDLDILKVLPLRGTFKNQKAFSFRGASPPWPLTRGSAPGPRWGLRPQTPVIGSRSTRSPWPRVLLAPPTFKHFQRPCPIRRYNCRSPTNVCSIPLLRVELLHSYIELSRTIMLNKLWNTKISSIYTLITKLSVKPKRKQSKVWWK